MPLFLTGPLPDATILVPYSQPIQVTGGVGVCTFFVTNGQLPPGLILIGGAASQVSLSSSVTTNQVVASQVLVQGTPDITDSGLYSFTVLAVDQAKNSVSKVFTINVGGAVAFDLTDDAGTIQLTNDAGTINLTSV